MFYDRTFHHFLALVAAYAVVAEFLATFQGVSPAAESGERQS